MLLLWRKMVESLRDPGHVVCDGAIHCLSVGCVHVFVLFIAISGFSSDPAGSPWQLVVSPCGRELSPQSLPRELLHQRIRQHGLCVVP